MAKAIAFCAVGTLVGAQDTCSTKSESRPDFNVMDCSDNSKCSANSNTGVVMDANWRWAHDASSQNCYSGDAWASICSDPIACAQKCCLEGVNYAGDSGVKGVSGGVELGFVTQTAYGKSVGSRLYVTEGDKYMQFNMLDKEIAFDVDVSALECGMNGAVYFVEMSPDGELGGDNKAGALRGTGYCDGQCARDIKFSEGHANSKGWTPNEKDPYHNTGSGSEGYCCAEMDLWEANKISTAFTAHPMTGSGKITCQGDDECGNQQDKRYVAPSDRDGCDINAYRNGDHTFYGPGSDFAVDTTKPITVVTQFYTAGGDLSEIKQFYVQNGKAVAHRNPLWSSANSITDEFCKEQKVHFDDQDEFTAKGGLKQMGESFKRGMTLVLSLWDDPMSGMEWLDSIDDKGTARGSCAKGSGDPATLRQQYASSSVSYKNLKWGAIGSTQSVYPPDAPTPRPSPRPTPAPTFPGPAPSPVPSPPSGDCPGGSLSACLDLCPRDPATVYQICVQTCVQRCPGAAPMV